MPGDLRRRWLVMAGLFLLSFITIVDRVAISAAKTAMAAELRIPDTSFGLVFGAFALGYAVFMVPAGWLADRLGPRIFLSLIVAIWSLFTSLTAAASSIVVLVAVRFLFGMAESGAYPTAALAIRNCFPVRERGLALGLLNTGSRLGAALGLFIVSLGVEAFGWRASFLALGALGFLWTVVWYTRFQEGTKESAQPSRVSGAQQKHTSWASLLNRNSVLILAQYFAQNFTFFICFSWLLPYLHSHYGLPVSKAGAYASIPLYCGAAATWMSGLLVDRLYARSHRAWSRRLPAILGYGLASGGVLIAAAMPTPGAFIACFAVATFGIDLTLSPSWTACADVGKESTGTLSAIMNAVGSAGAFASSVSFPWLLKLTGSATVYFSAAACLNVGAIVCWLLIRPPEPPEKREPV